MPAHFSFELSSRSDLQTVAKGHGADLSVVDCGPLDRQGMVMLLNIEGASEAVSATVTSIRSMKGVRRVYEGDSSENQMRLMIVLEKPGVCKSSSGLDILCLDCPFNSTEAPSRWTFVAKRATDADRIAKRLRREGIENKEVGSSPLQEEPLLTPKQKEVIATAFATGYFDFPRKATLSDLSRLTGMTPLEIQRALGSKD